jgi:MOSC domain-containing protein YiiM
MPGSVLAVRIKKSPQGPTEPADMLRLEANNGIVGDAHFGSKTRQVLLLDISTLDSFGYSPGMLREQILVDFDGLQELPDGTELSIGSARIRITGDCAPCRTMAVYAQEDPVAFVNKMMGKRGMLADVTQSGEIAAGDSVTAHE